MLNRKTKVLAALNGAAFGVAISALVILLAVQCGCLKTEVARGPNTEWRVRELNKQGLHTPGEWRYGKLKSGSDRIYGVMFERDGDELVVHCIETYYEYPRIDRYGGPWETRNLPFRECSNEWLISLLGVIDA